MHVLYLHQYFATNASSAGTRSYDFARRLVERGHKVTMITGMHSASSMRCGARLWSRQAIDGIDVFVLNVHYDSTLGGLGRASSFLRYAALASVLVVVHDRPDVIYATCTPPTVGLPALTARLLRGVPFVYELRDLWPEGLIAVGLSPRHPAVPILRAWNQLVFRGASKLVIITPGFLAPVLEYGVSRTDVEFLPLGADPSLFPAPATASLRTNGIGPDDLLVVYAGALGRANNVNYLLQAMACLRDRPDIKLLILGAGPEQPALLAEASRQNLTNVVFRSPIPKSELAAALGSADVGVNCGRDGFQNRVALPNKAFDYLCAGLAVLATAPTGGGGTLQDLVEQEGCGQGVDACQPGEAAECLAAWADDRTQLSAMKARSRLVAQRFDRKDLAARFEALLQALV